MLLVSVTRNATRFVPGVVLAGLVGFFVTRAGRGPFGQLAPRAEGLCSECRGRHARGHGPHRVAFAPVRHGRSARRIRHRAHL
jgi:hypothetical protein